MLSHQKAILLFGDSIALVLSFCAMAIIRFDVGAQGSLIVQQVGFFALIFAIWLIVLFIFDLYNLRRVNPNPRNIGLLITAMLINVLLGVVLFYLVPNIGISPKTNLVILAVCAFIFLTLWRRLFYLLFTRQFVRRIVIIGNHPLIKHLTAELASHPHFGTVATLWETVPDDDTDIEADLIIAHNVAPETLLRLSRHFGTHTLSLTEAYETIFAKIPVELMTDEKAIHYMADRSTRAQAVVYRVLEIFIASLVLIISSPFLLIAIIARLIEDGSPIFICQTRVGKDGTLFGLYKLRSMKVMNTDGSAEVSGAAWANKTDTRITRVGHILRKTHIDEVPQMINIIKGDLALIGPRAQRPEFVSILERDVPYYYLRHTIRPGFTGWAQIKFRYARSVDDEREKFEYDLYYLKNSSPLLDIGIILKTVQIIFTH